MWWRRAGSVPLERVQRLARRAVADGVHVDLEPGVVERPHRLTQRGGLDEGVAGVAGRPAVVVEVRRGQRRREVLRDAVLHDLHGRGAEPAAGHRLAPPDEVGHLLDAEPPFPPQGTHHVGAQVAVAGRGDVGRRRVVHPGVGADDRVLPAGDAERVQVGLPLHQGRVVLLPRRARQQARDQRGRPLVQRAARPPVRVPLDASVGGVGGPAVDAGELDRARVDPRAVVVAVGQVDGPVRHHRVEVGGQRGPAGERRHRPPSADDPRQVRAVGGVLPDGPEVVLAGLPPREVAAQPLETTLDRMDVGVDEARHDQAAGHVDHLGSGGPVARHRPHGRHPPPVEKHRGRTEVARAVEHGAAGEQDTGHARFLPVRQTASHDEIRTNCGDMATDSLAYGGFSPA